MLKLVKSSLAIAFVVSSAYVTACPLCSTYVNPTCPHTQSLQARNIGVCESNPGATGECFDVAQSSCFCTNGDPGNPAVRVTVYTFNGYGIPSSCTSGGCV